MSFDRIDISNKKALTDSQINQIVTVLKKGGLIIFPTETTYGAGVDATNPQAVVKLLAYKSRREGKPLSIAVASATAAQKFIQPSAQADSLFQRFLPGPVTVVCKVSAEGRRQLAPGVVSEFDTVGIRIPDYPLFMPLLERYPHPLTATSANGSGKKRPYSIDDVFEHLSTKQKELVDLVVDAGQLPKNPPSSIIDTTHATPLTVRSGIVSHQSQQSVITHSANETKLLAGKLVLKQWDIVSETGLVIGLNGTLGAGKTVFAQGVAKFLQIDETISSPTYHYLESYPYQRHQAKGTFHHLDVWKLNTAEEVEFLKLESLKIPGSVVVIEWWSNIAQFFEGKNFLDLTVTLEENGFDQRILTLNEQS